MQLINPVRGARTGLLDARYVDACFVDGLGQWQQIPWPEAAQQVVLEDCPPVRTFPVHPGKRIAPGWWWSATTGRLVHYGSGLMRAQVMFLDRDPSVTALACCPVELAWRDSQGTVRSHAPQLLARLADGSGVLIDCVGSGGVPRRLVPVARQVAHAAESVGWHYRIVGPPDPLVAANMRWLAGYRHPRYGGACLSAEVVRAFREPRPLVEAVEQLGDPIAVWPLVFHALWTGALSVSLEMPLHERTVAVAARSGWGER